MIKKILLVTCLGMAFTQSACANEQAPESKEVEFEAADSSWRDLDPENTLYIDTDHGRIVVELYPEISPLHVAQIKTLTRQSFYDNLLFHRVLKDFMNQTGDPKGNGTGDSTLPDIPSEFSFRRSTDMNMAMYGQSKNKLGTGKIDTGFYKSLPVATKPIGQAFATKDGKVEAYGLHCKGVTSMARSDDPNSANSQIFLLRGKADHLDSLYSVWGSTVWGRKNLTKIKLGVVGEDDNFIPDVMNRVRIAADLPEEERLPLQALKTDSPEFKVYLETKSAKVGENADICDLNVPSRLKK